MTNRTRFLAIAFAALCAAQARAGDDEPTDQVKLSTTLTEVTSFPEAYRRVPFELELLYHGPRELYNPYYTLFEPATYMNFAAWPADKPIWNRDAFVDDYPLFYVDRKNSVLEHQMVALKPFTWFNARCIVKSTAQGRAWIEVLSVTATNGTLDLADMKHLVRANVLASGGEFDRALLEFGMAKMTNAPARFVARYHVDQGRVALAANQPGRAMSELQAALPALPDDKEVAALLDRATGNTTAPFVQPQVASAPTNAPATAPTNVPPPLNLNGGARPAKANEPKRSEAPKSDATPPAIDPIAPKSEPVKTPAPIDPMPEPAAAPKGDSAPAAKPAPKSESTDAPKKESTPAEKPAAPKSEPKPQDPSGEKPAPSGDGAKPAEKPADKPEGSPAPADKPADAPEAKKDAPAPSEPKPGDAPESKPGDAPAEKPENAPEEKPADPPADKPKPDNGG